MRTIWIPTALTAGLLTGCAGLPRPGAQGGHAFYVSPAGNDAWSGQLAAPVADGTDGPFASVGRAQAAVRELRQGSQGVAAPCSVLLRGGTYRIAEPLRFTPADSGAAGAPVVYAAYPGERPVISGGRPIAGWRQAEDGLWVAEIPEVKAGTWSVTQLFVNGARRPRCRLPHQGYFRADGPLAPLTDKKAARSDPDARIGFRFKAGDLRQWDGWQDMNVVVFHAWTASVHWVQAIDETERTVRFTAPSGWPMCNWERNQRYYVENVRAALGIPGEWYLDRAAGRLYYKPLPGETLAGFEAVAPVLDQLLVLQVDAALGLFVEHLEFRGLSFQHSAWSLPRDKAHDGQAAVSVTGAIHTRGAHACRFADIEVAHVGTYGVWFAEGSQENVLSRAELHDLGAGGVKIGETSSPPDERTACRGNTVDNCFIHDGGKVFLAGIGVWVGRASGNAVTHNEICDFAYTGVSVGWCWGYAASSANHNRVEYNHIHHIGGGVLSDMGGIYTLGVSPGTVLRGNVIHDIYAYSYGGWGLYTDEGSAEILMEKNVVYRTKSGGFHQHYGRENVLRHNILAFASEAEVIRTREEEHLSFTFERNIVLVDNGAALGGNWSNGRYRLDRNLYWDVKGQDLAFGGWGLADWRAEGQDANSVVADPQFVDAAAGDFRLRRGSPAHALGIEPLADLRQAGLYGEARWMRRAQGVAHQAVDPEMQPPQKLAPAVHTVVDDFESTPTGERPAGATVSGEDKGASIRVSADRGANGSRQGLKFVDVPGLDHEWQPHMSYRLNWPNGRAVGAFDVWLEPDAILWHEWRDSSSPYKVGPSITLNGKGELVHGGKVLATFPVRQWLRVEIRCALGKAAKGTFDLAVTAPGAAAQTFNGLAFGSPDWNRLTWLGFVSNGTVSASFCVDNLDFRRQ